MTTLSLQVCCITLPPNLVEKKYRVDRHPFPIAGAKKSSNHSPVGSAKAIDNRGQL